MGGIIEVVVEAGVVVLDDRGERARERRRRAEDERDRDGESETLPAFSPHAFPPGIFEDPATLGGTPSLSETHPDPGAAGPPSFS